MALRLVLRMWAAAVLGIITGNQAAAQVSAPSGNGADVALSLGIKLWTWNAGKADVSQAAQEMLEEAYSQPEVKVVVACQTESNKPILEFVNDSKWTLVSHGEHWRSSLYGSTAQMMTVLYRKGSDHNLTREPVNMRTRKKWKQARPGVKNLARKDYIMPAVLLPNTLNASSRLHTLDQKKGWGGVSVLLEFQESQLWTRTSLAFLCAHLDPDSENQRDVGMTRLVVSSMRRDDFVNARDNGIERVYEYPSFFVKETAHLQPRIDALFVLGNLNYKIPLRTPQTGRGIQSYDITNDQEMAELYAGSKRKWLARDDPLSPHRELTKKLIVDKMSGFGLECNQPHTKYLPTYKRVDRVACLALNYALPKYAGKAFDAEMQRLVKKCYVGNLHRPWARRGWFRSYLDAGWLERFCWKPITDSVSKIQLVEERAWPSISWSDHTPISATLRVSLKPRASTMRRSVAELGENVALSTLTTTMPANESTTTSQRPVIATNATTTTTTGTTQVNATAPTVATAALDHGFEQANATPTSTETSETEATTHETYETSAEASDADLNSNITDATTVISQVNPAPTSADATAGAHEDDRSATSAKSSDYVDEDDRSATSAESSSEEEESVGSQATTSSSSPAEHKAVTSDANTHLAFAHTAREGLLVQLSGLRSPVFASGLGVVVCLAYAVVVSWRRRNGGSRSLSIGDDLTLELRSVA
eukprot:TRINITY_DN3613_c0_g2_i1.p1 TRINITY_DN3613_c0_g2~~TRINITY_DN3613_c0_g2_i1.p1  ORF type:complete len:708 (+),score=46.79 TRINITY_DN3613_c0_g2_i1:93-2216(+)